MSTKSTKTRKAQARKAKARKSNQTKKRNPAHRQPNAPHAGSGYGTMPQLAAHVPCSLSHFRRAFINTGKVSTKLIGALRVGRFDDVDRVLAELPEQPIPALAPSPMFRANTPHAKRMRREATAQPAEAQVTPAE